MDPSDTEKADMRIVQAAAQEVDVIYSYWHILYSHTCTHMENHLVFFNVGSLDSD